jgi:cobalt/nickel transport protein
MAKRKKTVVVLIILIVVILFSPLFLLRGSEFEGSDGAGSDMVAEVADEGFEPWFVPVLERVIGGELPGEMETFFFCLQTGIGVGILAYCFGYLTARKKYGGDNTDDKKKSA